MRIFVGYGYNPRDKWIEEMVFPIITAFGSEVVDGKEMYGEELSQGVIERINGSDRLIAFTTKREAIQGSESWTTHKWVQQELANAIGKIPVLEVREKNVDPQIGLDGNRQRITYEETERDKCLVEIVKAIGIWHQGNVVDLQLLPKEFIETIRPLLRNPRLKCRYKLRIKNREHEPVEATIQPITGGLFLTGASVPRDALIRIFVECDDKSWSSGYESVSSIGIQLYKDQT